MKFCVKCGNEMPEADAFCTRCGHSAGAEIKASQKSCSVLKILAGIFMIIATVTSAICSIFVFFIPITLAWCLPMTLVYYSNIRKGKKISVAFKICSLIFVSLPAGILMLCDDN